MKKSLFALFLSFMILFTGCSNTAQKSETNQNNSSAQKTSTKKDIKPAEKLTILIQTEKWNQFDGLQQKYPLDYFSKKFEEETGIELEFEEILKDFGGENKTYEQAESEFKQQLNSKLYSGSGPTLICLKDSLAQLNAFSKCGAFEDITDIKNYDSIGHTMKGENFISPIFNAGNIIVPKEFIDDSDIDLTQYLTGMTSSDRYELFKTLNPDVTIPFSNFAFYYVTGAFNDFKLKIKDGKAAFTLDELKSDTKKVRDEFYSGRFNMPEDLNSDTLKNYTSSESKQAIEANTYINKLIEDRELKETDRSFSMWRFSNRVFYSPSIYIPDSNNYSMANYSPSDMYYIPFKDGYNQGLGFMLNSSASDADKAAAKKYLEFITSEEVQKEFFDLICMSFDEDGAHFPNDGFGPSVVSVVDFAKEKTKNNPEFKAFSDLIESTFNFLNDPEYADKYLNGQSSLPFDAFGDINELYDKCLFNNGEISDEELQTEFDQIIEKINIKISELSLPDTK